MTLKPRTLCLALLAACALGALGAANALAQPFNFRWEAPAAKNTELPDGKVAWVFGAGKFECEDKGEGEGSGTESSEIIIGPTSGECVEAPAKIDFNGCSFGYRTLMFEGGSYEGSADINCPVGKSIEVTAPGCTMTVTAQVGLKKITFKNKGAGKEREVTVDLNLAGITYVEDKQGLFPTCIEPGKVKNNGAITGSMTLTSENAKKEMIGLWVA